MWVAELGCDEWIWHRLPETELSSLAAMPGSGGRVLGCLCERRYGEIIRVSVCQSSGWQCRYCDRAAREMDALLLDAKAFVGRVRNAKSTPFHRFHGNV